MQKLRVRCAPIKGGTILIVRDGWASMWRGTHRGFGGLKNGLLGGVQLDGEEEVDAQVHLRTRSTAQRDELCVCCCVHGMRFSLPHVAAARGLVVPHGEKASIGGLASHSQLHSRPPTGLPLPLTYKVN